MHHRNERHPVERMGERRAPAFELVSTNTTVVWKTAQTISSRMPENKKCPKCERALHEDYTLVPVTAQQKAKVPGLLCPHCEIIYVQESQELTKIMRDNPLIKGFTLDGHELWNASIMEKKRREEEAARQKEAACQKQALEKLARRKKHLRHIQDSVVMVCIKTNDGTQEYIITNREPNDAGSGIYSYKSFKGRELLSAAFAKERNKSGVLSEVEFEVVDVVFAQDHDELPEYIRPTWLAIKADGGYISSIQNQNFELVDLLVYSPFSDRYELMRSTHDKEEQYCFTDISIFRRYVYEYGNPGMCLDFLSAASGSFSLHDLRTESVLMEFCYSVSEANNVSERKRHEILAEIVDLGILTVHEIVKRLDFNCRLHKEDKYYLARQKWERDKMFIENYKVNPNRFLIANMKK